MAYGLVEKCLQRHLIGEFGFNLVDEKTGRTIPLFLSIMRAEFNGITHSRMELYTFDAGPGTYRLSVTEDLFVLDAVMKKVGDKVIKDDIDYNQFTIQSIHILPLF